MKVEIYCEGGHLVVESGGRGYSSFSRFFWENVPPFIGHVNPGVRIERVTVSERQTPDNPAHPSGSPEGARGTGEQR